MKKYFTKITALVAILLTMSVFSLQAKEDDATIRKDLKEQLPYLMGSNNAGTLFYLAFHPCWETNSNGNALRIYISSAVATTVTLEIKGLGIFRQKMTIPNDVIDFMLTPSEGQPYTKTDRFAPLPEAVWEGRAVKITSEDPIIVYGVTRFYATSDGYLALPASSLSLNYQVSSYADPTNNTFQWLPSYTSIIGVYDNTRVTFRMGGCESCFALKEDGEYLRFNQTIRRTLNEGDVWLIPGIGPFNDLTGSTVKANKPISVISGNFCAYIPSHIAACDFIIEQEMPENMWGTKYHVTPMHTRKNYGIIKLFAKKPFTDISSDGNPVYHIATPGGIFGTGYIETRSGVMGPGDVEPKPVEISSNQPINVVQFNPGSQDDGIENDPFQLVLTPTQQYQTEIVFCTPGLRGQYGFKNNFLNIVYKATSDGGIPADMMWAEVVDGKFNWIPMSSYSGNPGQRFVTTEPDGRHYRSKFIKLPYDGVYRLKANDPLAAYAYGSDYYDSYGFPTSVATADLETPDSLAPYVEFARDCSGDVTGVVIDEPRIDPPNRSNLGLVYMATEDSYNYKFEVEPFIAGTDARTNWTLTVKNSALNAQAHLVFMDRVGNRTDTTILHYAISPVLTPYYKDYGTFKVEQPNLEKTMQFTVKNEGNNAITSQYAIYVIIDSDNQENKPGDINTYQNFDLVGIKDVNLSPMAVGQERKFDVKFTARAEGTYRDSVGIIVIDKSTGDTCVRQYFAEVVAFVGNPYITAIDKNFYEQVVDTRTTKYDLTVTNPNTGSYVATTSLKITGIVFTGDEIGHSGSDAVFEVEGLANVSDVNPIIIAPGASRTFSVSFKPKAVRSYKSVITFTADATLPKNFTVLEGIGIQPGLLVNGDDWGERLVDPNSYIQKGGTYPYTPYASPNGAIVLSNDGSAVVTLKVPTIVTDFNGSAFKYAVDGRSLTAPGVLDDLFNNQKIQPNGSLTIPVVFDPKINGNHELVLRFLSDALSTPTSTLVGIGVFPKSETENVDFGHSIVGTPKKVKSVDFKTFTWINDYPLTITDFVATPSNAATTITDFAGNGTFRWDKNGIKDKDGNVVTLPITLQSGDFLTINGEFEPTVAGSFEATITTVSDAEVEPVSTWTATSEVEGSVMTPATAITCVNSPIVLRPKIKNLGTNQLIINGVTIDPASGSFVIQNQTFTLAPAGQTGDEQEIVITYTPTVETINQVFEVIVQTSSTTKPIDFTTITVTSTHVVQPSYSLVSKGGGTGTAKSVEVNPGVGEAVGYSIFLNTTEGVPLAESMVFEVKVNYSKKFLGLAYHNRELKQAKVTIGSKLAELGWTLDANVTDTDTLTNMETITITFRGSSALKGSFGDLELATVIFDSYLPWYKDSQGNVVIDTKPTVIEHVILNNDPCVAYTSESSSVSLSPTCVDDLRPIKISTKKYKLNPIAPNPVGSNGADVSFSVGGNNIFTEVKIYNSNSELVATVFSGTLNPGEYSARIPVENLSSGMYFIEMVSGPFTSGYEKLIISK